MTYIEYGSKMLYLGDLHTAFKEFYSSVKYLYRSLTYTSIVCLNSCGVIHLLIFKYFEYYLLVSILCIQT